MNNNYLSVVVTTRNDNHGGDLLKRTTCFVEGLFFQAKKFNVPIELIIVEWNPPKGKPLLKDALPKPYDGVPVTVRYIIVSEDIHNIYTFSNRIPLFQMTAKNVGIRRATSEFVLCTNIDLLFSDELFMFLKNERLEKGNFYRANRCDIPSEVMDIQALPDQIKYAESNILKRMGKSRGHEYLFGLPRFIYGFTNTIKILNAVFKWVIKATNSPLEFEIWSTDTEACGDFTLMHIDDWIKIEGYPELDLYSIHIDSMALVAARALGIKQYIMPRNACSYHIFHEDGWESFGKNPVDLVRFIEKRPGLDWFSVSQAAKWMLVNKKGWGLNKPDWGFTSEGFKEYVFKSDNSMLEVN